MFVLFIGIDRISCELEEIGHSLCTLKNLYPNIIMESKTTNVNDVLINMKTPNITFIVITKSKIKIEYKYIHRVIISLSLAKLLQTSVIYNPIYSCTSMIIASRNHNHNMQGE